ncbi:MAG: phosphate acetyltransferase [Bifidobacteriaceae bacterium]|nr:phosphate acetyltransferase [Bifidobacteriaceae bacterium]
MKYNEKLYEMAAKCRKRIVLPEGNDPRVLKAAAEVLSLGIADLVILDEEKVAHKLAKEIGARIDGAEVIDDFAPYIDEYAAEFAEVRKAKGVTIEDARKQVKDISYFATMMAYLGKVDGMVSGAIHTTADTIRPALQIVKTKPGVSVVSGAMLMVIKDKVLLYADCAVNPNPTPQQLAQIAISSAETALKFGITPKIAMLSYSTGTSGKGSDVDAVIEATEIAKQKAGESEVDIIPDDIEGPIQYDAAVDKDVAAIKLPNSKVAGQANVFIFPNLSTGNICYKAVQREANALAIGPLLQGLKKPTNDLSRGALVADIVNTIAVTAIQAG